MNMPCVRCGMCCTVQTCNYGRRKYGVVRNTRCPGLQFSDRLAVCPDFPEATANDAFIEGCSMSALVLVGGRPRTWKSLAGQTKHYCARLWRERKEKAA